MKKALLLVLLTVFSVNAQNSRWSETTSARVENLTKMDRESFPLEYKLFQLNLNAMKIDLNTAPNRDVSFSSNTIID